MSLTSRIHGLVLILILLGLDGAAIVWAFAEEPLGFRDPAGHYYDPDAGYPEISTIHDDVTYALALAAGFTVTQSQTLRIWNQLVDSEELPGAPVSYAYGNAEFPAAPVASAVCGSEPHVQKVWPTNSFDTATSGVTSRFGPYSPFFHFPRQDGWEIHTLHDWAWGIAPTLAGYEAYAWGALGTRSAFQAMDPSAGCAITRTGTIGMPVAAGSLEAFATYLHSLADSYSHADCMTALAGLTPPVIWGTHTVTTALVGDPSVPACDYDPMQPTATDAHGEEFAGGAGTYRTDAALRAVYAELALRSRSRDGLYFPLPLATTLVVSGTTTTLDGALTLIVHQWAFDRASDRRVYGDRLVAAIAAQPRTLIPRVYLPHIRK